VLCNLQVVALPIVVLSTGLHIMYPYKDTAAAAKKGEGERKKEK
jgi:hypothetical protein